ncbi:hypothetical protein EJ110_NYTH52704 [Nymphaea thermarum]|nr:hypothetical protein EJ110_NYTH52704 [Nymphaea thermarum]
MKARDPRERKSFSKMAAFSRRSSGMPPSPALFSFFFVSLFLCSLSSSTQVTYKPHCDSIVSEASRDGEVLSTPLGLPDSFLYRGAESILGRNVRQSLLLSTFSLAKFTEKGVYATDRPGILRVDAYLLIEGSRRWGNSSFSVSPSFQPRLPKRFRSRGSISLSLGGFWEESSGMLCMVGSGLGVSGEGTNFDLSAVLKLNFTKNSTIERSLVTGALEFLSKDDGSDVNKVEPMSLLGVSRLNHSYSLDSEAKGMCSASEAGHSAVSAKGNFCFSLQRMSFSSLYLEYEQDCKSGNCSIFSSDEGRSTSMVLASLDCSSEGKVFLLFGFSNVTYGPQSRFYRGLPGVVPLERTLIGEGIWDEKSNQLCFSVCRFLNHSHSLAGAWIGDCTIGMNLSFHSRLTLKDRRTVEGSIWSNKRLNESGYFRRLSFGQERDLAEVDIVNFRYEFTQYERVRKMCKADAKKHPGMLYPDGYSSNEMVFQVSVKNSLKQRTWGTLYPLANDGGVYPDKFANVSQVMYAASPVQSYNGQSPLNISYVVDIHLPSTFHLDGISPKISSLVISAEGVYDPRTGVLCMVGCRHVRQDNGTNVMDCEISMNFQLPPLSTENFAVGEQFSGTIKSIRKSEDPLYFKSLKLWSSVPYLVQTRTQVLMMDTEIAMVLISLTLVSIFVLLQLLHVKKHPEVLPFVSLGMAAVLTLGYMIPLVLNFEASFAHGHTATLYVTERWVQVDEILVRVITLIAFLLQFRLLQLVWSARTSSSVSESNSFSLCLLLYIVGGLFACFAHWKSSEYIRELGVGQPSVLEDLESYAGLVLDGFLLPQVLLNLFAHLKEKALSPSFFIGLTAVRSFPHIYDAYRSFYNIPRQGLSYYYADPEWDFYSAAWDFMIPLVGTVFAILIYLQQRFGGRCILPRKLRERIEYEKVPVVLS